MPTEKEGRAFVIDASIAVKWFSFEKGSSAARKLLEEGQMEKIQLVAPDLLLYEVGNALGRGKGLGAKNVIDALDLLFRSSIEFVKLDKRMVERTAAFMESYVLTFYDACYAAIAYERGAALISANPRDHRKIKEIIFRELTSFKKA